MQFFAKVTGVEKRKDEEEKNMRLWERKNRRELGGKYAQLQGAVSFLSVSQNFFNFA